MLGLVVLGAALFAAASPSRAVLPDELLADAALEARARALSAGLRCLVCQNQSIDDSDAPLARDLRILVRERLSAGDSDEAVRAFVVARYGEFVLLKPPLAWNTLVLWLMPVVLLVGAGGLVAWRGAGSSLQGARQRAPGLSAEEEEKLKAALAKSQSDPEAR